MLFRSSSAGSYNNFASIDATGGSSPAALTSSCTTSSCPVYAGITVKTPSHFILSKAAPSSVNTGASFSYTLNIGNSGGSDSTGTSVTISEQMPAGVTPTGVATGTHVSAVNCGTLPAAAGSLLTCTVTLDAAMPANTVNASPNSATFTISATAGAAGTVTNYATVDPSGGTSPATALNCAASSICGTATTVISSGTATLTLDKVASAKNVELGDSVMYTLTLRHVSGGAQTGVAITDNLPLGFKYIPNTVKVVRTGTSTAVSSGDTAVGVTGVGPTLQFTIGSMSSGDVDTITYRVRVGVGAMQGTGINRATARSASGVSSNEARATVKVDNGVFAQEGCIIGKVYLDCNGNGIQDRDDGNEPGVGGVRLYTEDGTYMISDPHGSYSICGIPAMTHVLKLDKTTLPGGAQLGISANRNAGDPDSIFIDMKFGELHRADFIINNCSSELLERVVNPAARAGTLPPNSKLPTNTKTFSSKEQREGNQNSEGGR